MSRESRIISTTEDAAELLLRATNALPSVLAVIAAERTAVHVRAQAYDTVRVSGFTTQQDDDGHPIPVRHDPVGEHVVNSDERSDAALLPIEAAARAVTSAVETLVRALQPHQAGVRLATTDLPTLRAEAKERALEEARVERANTRHCRSCARATNRAGEPINETDIYRRGDVGGRLDDVMDLCRWCYRKVEQLGYLPPPEWIQRHHRGEQINVSTELRIKTSTHLPEVLR